MKLFALSDLHLSFDAAGNLYKPMDVFGEIWRDHEKSIRRYWTEQVTVEDVVLLPGDLSWAMTLEEVQPDLAFLAELPGRKIISKGNHDLWWDSLRKVQAILPEGVSVLQNNSFVFGDVAICGTRGWLCPGEFSDAHDEKIFQREVGRLKLSLDSVPKEVKYKIVMLHFPPVNSKREKNALIDLMQQYDVELCLYGHLHSYAIQTALEGSMWEMEFRLVSADHLGFAPRLICEI